MNSARRSDSVRFYDAVAATPLGEMLLRADGEGRLTGLYFTDQRDTPKLDGLGLGEARTPSAGLADGQPIRLLKAVPAGSQNGDLFASSGSGAAINMPKPGPLRWLHAEPAAPARALLQDAHRQLADYLAGRLRVFDLPLCLHGTEFQRRVWDALLTIAYGDLVSYAEVARRAGLGEGHGRAVGAAVGRNPVSIVVPCHRVVSSQGLMTGYTGGLERKVALLGLEGCTLH